MKWIFILVEPAVPENIGASARAMKTMGFDHLRLVNPCEFGQGKARWMAHASGDILDRASVFPSLEAAIADVDFVVGTSAKMRSVKGDHHPVDRLPELIQNKLNIIGSVAIVFGREESGLTNDEMKQCHISTYIPMATAYPSLNLAQAVMLYTYLLSPHKNHISAADKSVGEGKFTAASLGLKDLLSETKIGRNPTIFNRIMERFALLGDQDVNLVMSAVAALKEKYREYKLR